MFWYRMILVLTWAQSFKLWTDWGFRITVLLSLGANLMVALLSGTRRRLASGRWLGWLGQLAKLCLWLACQVGEAATTSAIGSLSLSDSDASVEDKQVVAFWATFLLLHLGGPDNLTAYSLEDNKISNRKWVEIVANIWGAGYAIYNSTHGRGGGRSWALLPAASGIMLLAGAVRYIERAMALMTANLDSMQEDASSSSSSKGDEVRKMDLLKSRIMWAKGRGRWLGDREVLLLAQDLFPIWHHALVDSSVDPKSPRQEANVMIVSEWDSETMCKVAEMELSLMYEFLYTKAIMAHTWTWFYYLIRLLSPFVTTAAAFLFCFWLQQQQGVGGSYVKITYALLAITFLMDVAWLLSALGSTWAYAYLREQAPAWLRHQARHGSVRWWRSVHRIIVRLDPASIRRWSGTIGRYNLLDECTVTTARSGSTTPTCYSQFLDWWPWSKAGDDRPKEMRYLCKLPHYVKEVLLERVTEILKQAIKEDGEEKEKEADGGEGKNDGEKKRKEEEYSRLDIRTRWGLKALTCAIKKKKINLPEEVDLSEDQTANKRKKKWSAEDCFGDEFEVDVLLWHIATCMVLSQRQEAAGEKHARAIEVLSEYMMFLVAVRRQMLPGLVLHSQLQVTRDKLKEIWRNRKVNIESFLPPDANKSEMKNKEKLAMILRHVTTTEREQPSTLQEVYVKGSEGTRLLVHAVKLYFYLSGDKRPAGRRPLVTEDRLEVIFNVWVDKLVYAAVRCSREAHAKQLSAGGDLTNVLWMLIQHAGPFSMGEAPNIILTPPTDGKGPTKKADEPASAPALPVPGRPPAPAPTLPVPGRPPAPAPALPVPGRPPAPAPALPVPGRPPAPAPTLPVPGRPPAPAPALPVPGRPPAPAPLPQVPPPQMYPPGPPMDGWPPTIAGIPASPQPGPMSPSWPAPEPPYCPLCPPCYQPSYPPGMYPPCYDPSWAPVCPWHPQYPSEHEEPGDEAEEPREEDEREYSSSSSDEESEE